MIHKNHHSWRGGLGRLCAAGALLLLPTLGTAATRTVTSLNDSGAGSLREAIGASVNGDTINFSVAGTITLTSGELLIGRSIAINGPTLASLTVSGKNASRVFNISSGITVNISRLTIIRGRSNDLVDGGGGILNNGTLTVDNSTFSGNAASDGGGIYTRGTLTVNNSTFSGNVASYAGGIYNIGTLTVNNSTLSGNTAGYGGGGIGNKGTLNILNTISANNSGRFDIDSVAVTSQGHNLIGVNGVGGGWVSSDLVGSTASPLNPHLGPLQNNGGPTFTMALLPISAAIDAGDDAVLGPPYNLSTDQRGRARRTGDHVDIGAHELSTITRLVTTTSDGGGGSLRNAIATAGPLDRILFAPVVRGKIRLTDGELFINKPLSIVGPGAAALAISGNSNSRVFHIGPQGDVEIYGLTVTEGLVQGPQAPSAQPGTESRGAGLLNEASLRLFDCMLTTNKVQGGSGGDGCYSCSPRTVWGGPGGSGKGAAIYSSGSLELTRCTLVGNRALGGDGGRGVDDFSPGGGGDAGAGEGGAIWNTAITRLENCTLADNRVVGGRGGNPGADQFDRDARPGTGGNGLGGALHGPFVLESCTITANAVTQGLGGQGYSLTGASGAASGGGVNALGAPTIHNSIIAGNTSSATSQDVNDAVASQGWNLIGITDGSSGWMLNDLLGNAVSPLNPRLSACQDNGGPVWTMGPLAGSPARDAGNSGLPMDSRGGPRIVNFPNIPNAPGGDGSDIGALEVDSLFGAITIAAYPGSATTTGVVVVGFKSDPGTTYRLQQTSVVTSRVWTNIVGAVMTGNGQNLSAIDFGPFPPARFYRVRAD